MPDRSPARSCRWSSRRCASRVASRSCRVRRSARRARPRWSRSAPCCRRCGAPLPCPVDACPECRGRGLAFERAWAPFAYTGPARDVVLALKGRGLHVRRRLHGRGASRARAPPGCSRACSSPPGASRADAARTATTRPASWPRRSARRTGLPVRARAGAQAGRAAAGRPGAARPPRERARLDRGARPTCRAGTRVGAGRRRLHDRLDPRCLRGGAAGGRQRPGDGRLLRPHGPWRGCRGAEPGGGVACGAASAQPIRTTRR